MKKIFRMALVFALAGAALMYTGCTKDYSEEINSLDSEISALEGKYQDLLNQLTDAKTQLEAAYKAADKTLEGNFDKKIAEINAALAKKADAAAIEAEMEQLKKDLMAEADKLQQSAESLKKEVQDLLDEFYATMAGELRALVVIPDFYFAGVEATSYDFALLVPEKAVTAGLEFTENDTKYVFPKNDAKIYFKDDSTKLYSLGQQGVVNYDLNPSAFDVAEAEWALYGLDRKYIVKGDSAQPWAPKFLGIKNENGTAVVNYEIVNPDGLFASVIPDSTGYGNVPVMQLVAELEEGKTISSDWVAITSGVDSLAHLAFASANTCETDFADDCGLVENKTKDLYDSAKVAAIDSASYFVKYNGGSVDLANLINIHVKDAFGENDEWTLAELNAKYPGFSYKFELVPYTIGANVTGENYYGKIDGSMFTPCYVKSEGGKPKSIEIAKDAEEGISAVGRMPVVLVTLNDEDGNVVLDGYFKIQLTKEAVSVVPEYYDIPSFGKFPFVCDSLEKGTTWHEFSYFVLEALGVDYDQFINNYEFTGVYAETPEFIQIDTLGTTGETAYGTITYTKDATGSGINDAIAWKLAPQAIGAGKTQEVYLEFKGPKTVYFKLTAEIAEPAGFDFGANKLANEWFDDVNGEFMNTARVNVKVPVSQADIDGDSVTFYYRDLNRFYQGYKPGVKLSADSDPIYKETPDSLLETESKFFFASEQPKIDGKQLLINANADSLFVELVNGTAKDTAEVAVIDTTSGVITYCWAEGATAAKDLLNLWSYTETDQDKMLYANIIVKTTYGDCAIPAGDENFHVRFVRPLDVNFTSQDVAEESSVAGFNVLIAKFITGIVDWNHQNVIVPDSLDAEGNAVTYKANVIKGIDMYDYYHFDSLVVDLDNAKRDNWDPNNLDSLDLIKTQTPGVQIAVGTVDEDGIFTADSNTIDISDFANLKDAAINYQNDKAIVDKFNIYIPVKVYYSWGTMDAVLEIHVKPTSETDPK